MNEPKIYRFATNLVPGIKGEPGDDMEVHDFVLATEWFSLRDDWKSYFCTPEGVHMAMLRGQIARISMEQCAHLLGGDMTERWNKFLAWDAQSAEHESMKRKAMMFDELTPQLVQMGILT
jgi:hypothetical protein